jgi:two-component system nitrogen regulation sensor histidine kinase GlnL
MFSEMSAEQIIEHLSTAVLVFNARLQLVFINSAGEVMFAHSARYLCGRSVHEVIKNSEAMVEQLAAAITSEQVVIHHGCLLELPDTHDLRVNCTFTPISEGDGSVLVELRQIDHHLRIEQEEHLISQQRATHALVRGLAHEIKNPLGGLRGAAQLLEREINDESLKEYTQIIISEADRMHALMDRMLGPNTVPKLQDVNVHEVLEHVRELVQVESGDSLIFQQDYDPSLPGLQADPGLLIQALLNIVRNACSAQFQYWFTQASPGRMSGGDR